MAVGVLAFGVEGFQVMSTGPGRSQDLELRRYALGAWLWVSLGAGPSQGVILNPKP